MGRWAGLSAIGALGLIQGNALGWPWLSWLGGLLLLAGAGGALGFLAARRGAFLPWLRPAGLATLAFLVCAGPMLLYWAGHRQRVDDRPQRISIFQHSIPGTGSVVGPRAEHNVAATLA